MLQEQSIATWFCACIVFLVGFNVYQNLNNPKCNSKYFILINPQGLVSAGEAVYLWDFLIKRPPTPVLEGRMELTDIQVYTGGLHQLICH